jgi:hypothetical protein
MPNYERLVNLYVPGLVDQFNGTLCSEKLPPYIRCLTEVRSEGYFEQTRLSAYVGLNISDGVVLSLESAGTRLEVTHAEFPTSCVITDALLT